MLSEQRISAVLTVTQLTRSIKSLLESEYRFVRIQGQVSNLRVPYSGHSYFSLKDSESQVRAVLFKHQKRFISHSLKDGQQVICFGRISIYEPRGEYQLIIDSIDHLGTGQLQLEFEKLKAKLADEGLFAQDIKKEIPPLPFKIIVISSPTGAALQDFLKVYSIRNFPTHIQILPVRVQGDQAGKEIAGAIQAANRIKDADLIVLCRGGGSIEDLWAFNEEQTARAIFRSALPVVTGIGHETDFTIADFCADYRCPTPTSAATTVLPDGRELHNHLNNLKKRLRYRINTQVESLEIQLHSRMKILGNLERKFENLGLRLDLSKTYLVQAMTTGLTARKNRFLHQLQRLENNAPHAKLAENEQALQLSLTRLVNSFRIAIQAKETRLAKAAAILNSVSPLATLARGYAIVTRRKTSPSRQSVITDSRDVSVGEKLDILLHKGTVECEVTEISGSSPP
jgi:exodeoxyribonuclease VII large subunit